MDNDETDSVRDRFSDRFDSDGEEDSTQAGNDEADRNDRNDGNDGASMRSMNNGNEGNDRNEQKAESAGNGRTSKNVKKDWNARTVYLPDDLDGELATAYKRTDLDLSIETEADLSIKKTRHFYPLVVALGLEQLGGMDVHEVMERVEDLSP